MSKIIISNLAGEQELLLGISKDSVAIRRKINSEYSLTLQVLKTGKNAEAWNMLLHEAMLTFNDEIFIVKLLNKTPHAAVVTATHEFFEIENDWVDDILAEGTYTVNAAFAHALSNTPDWTFEILDTFSDLYLNDFGNDNPVSLIQTLVEQLGAEFTFSSKTNKLTVKKRIGLVTQHQVRPKYNLEEIAQVFDSKSIRTAIKVHYNPDVAGKYQNTVVVQSSNAVNYRRIKWAKPVEIDTTIEEDAISFGQSQLQDSPTISLNISFTHLQEWGYESNAIGLGDSFFLIDKRLNIDEEARIVELTTYPLSNKSPGVTLANRKRIVTDVMLQHRKKQQQLDRQAVKQNTLYDGVEMTHGNGLKISSYSGTVLWLNAEEGILIENGNVKKFYVDTEGNVTFDGRLLITNGDGVTPLLEAFLDTHGGRIMVYDKDGELNVKIGSEETNGGQRGGIVRLYDDGEDRLRVSIGATANYGGNGAMDLYDASGVARAGVFALGDAAFGGVHYVADQNGQVVSFLSQNEGRINNKIIATEDWVQLYVTNALASYAPPSP